MPGVAFLVPYVGLYDAAVYSGQDPSDMCASVLECVFAETACWLVRLHVLSAAGLAAALFFRLTGG